MTQLFAGPNAAERARGLDGVPDPTVRLLRSVRIRDKIAYVDLTSNFLQVNNISASCAKTIFMSGVENTRRQFQCVGEVRYAVEGDPAAFYNPHGDLLPQPSQGRRQVRRATVPPIVRPESLARQSKSARSLARVVALLGQRHYAVQAAQSAA